ncbi:MAG TPA: 2-oxo-4-hydroxy-4-carboxy-5-ureidoimidazoline decarboxylase, partial [Steroidobacteraceae bacterium]|nr:2-oxo-4-hydroxy-4-carboxy-5-ureidoimidazoline decarboxylase [Steroidobacteraceae bacterium]
MLTLAELNDLPPGGFVEVLANIYEHSPWVPERVAPLKPFASVPALHQALLAAVMAADEST